MNESLNCSNYEVYVSLRGGKQLVCRLKPIGITYTRILNDFSEAAITVAVDTACIDCLATINPWQHEILIFRSSQLVWCGPLMSINYQNSQDRVVLSARDLLAWTEKRYISIFNEDYDVEEVDIAEVFHWVLSHGYNKDPWSMTWSVGATGIPINKFYPGYFPPDRWGGTFPIVASELRSLAQSGIDYTVINRHMYSGDLVVTPPTTNLLKVTDQNWAKTPDITINGSTMSSRTAVAGGSGGYWGWYDDQIWVEESGEHPYGLLETFINHSQMTDADTTTTPNVITQEAAARHSILKNPIARIAGGQLSGQNPYDFNDLIPGLPVQVGFFKPIRKLLIDYRLYSLTVDVSKEAEAINMSLSAPGIDEIKL